MTRAHVPDLIYPEGSSCAVRVEGVRDQAGALVDGAFVRLTLRTMLGAVVEGFDDVLAPAVPGELGTYEWIAPAELGLAGRYRLEVRAARGPNVTLVERTVLVRPYGGDDA